MARVSKAVSCHSADMRTTPPNDPRSHAGVQRPGTGANTAFRSADNAGIVAEMATAIARILALRLPNSTGFVTWSWVLEQRSGVGNRCEKVCQVHRQSRH